MSIRTLWLADAELWNEVGHHLDYNSSLAAAARAEGWRPVVLCRRDFEFKPGDGVEVRGIFSKDLRSHPPMAFARWRRVLDFLEKISRRRFRIDLLDGLPATEVMREDVVFAQVLAPRHLSGWLHWLARFREAPALAVHLGYDPFRFVGDSEIEAAFRSLDAAGAASRIILVSDSESLARQYEEILRRKVWFLPHVVSPGIVPSGRPRGRGAITFCALGSPRREKGFSEIVDAARQLASEEGIRFVLQINDPDVHTADLVRELRQTTTGNVTLIDRRLSPAEYTAALLDADVMLLPYHLDKYRKRTSGIFCEALVAGRPVIGTKDSWMSAEITAGGNGWLVEEANPGNLADTIRLAAHQFADVWEKSQKLAPRHRETFDGGNFLKGLKRLVDHGGN